MQILRKIKRVECAGTHPTLGNNNYIEKLSLLLPKL